MPNWLKGERAAKSSPLTGASHWHRESGLAELASLPGGQGDESRLPKHADFVVIGGGFAGISAASAIAAAEPSASVVLLERNVLGFGASGRNAGLLGPLPAPVWLVSARHNVEHAWALKDINARVHALARRLSGLAEDAGVQEATLRLEAQGRLTGTGLSHVGDVLDHAGIAFQMARGRRGALALDIPANMIAPYRGVRAVAAEARARGVAIHEGIGVTAIAEVGDGVEIALENGGKIRAGVAVLSTNAYSGSVTVPGKIAAKPVWNFAVAAPLARDALPDAGAAHRFVVELNLSYVYYRCDGGRTVYGGIERFSAPPGAELAVPPDVLGRLEGLLSRTFPGRHPMPAEAWSGCYHQTTTDLPLLGRQGATGRIIVNAGYGGTGVALSMVCAPFVAAMARGDRFATVDDRRLYDAIKNTRVPIAGLARFVTGVGWDVVRRRRG